jgi:predicted transcriptional regulator
MGVMAKKKPAGRARETGLTRTFNFEISPELDDALERCAKAQDRTKRATVIRAIKAYLKAEGFLSHPAEGGKE